MASECSEKRTTAFQQSESDYIAVQFEALEPGRPDKLITPSFWEEQGPYVFGKTLRLKELEAVAKEGMTSQNFEKVSGWRCKLLSIRTLYALIAFDSCRCGG